jgi:cyclopropane-fatty-acyl-phospholipid synthase
MAGQLERLVAERFRGRSIPIRVHLPNGNAVALADQPDIDVYIRDWSAARTLTAPTMGALARAYVHDKLDFDGTARQVLGLAESLVGDLHHGGHSVASKVRSIAHRIRGNRANVQQHYDVSNAFYRLWLDRRMVYSCAYFRTGEDTLEAAQEQKLDHICRKLRLQPGETFLDIGCGWGGLIFWAAQHYGVQATGITLSQNQHDHVKAQIEELDLRDRVRVELVDYQDLPEDMPYDKIASVGMFEHVGVANYPRYFGKIRRLLRPGGLVLNHGITQNRVGVDELGSGIGDFVEQYVFPGGELAHVSKVIEGISAGGLEVIDAEALREHYAKTLWHWVDRLEANAEAARREAGEERFRVWRIYMAGSAHAFDRGWLSLFQILAGRPLDSGTLPKPLTRDYMYRN